MSQKKNGVIPILQEFSIPLIVGVFCALAAANFAPEWYRAWFGTVHGDDAHGVRHLPVHVFGHALTASFLINDVFMVFFFGIAAKEITEACLPGGNLNPVRKAINPLLATLGGVFGPVGVFFLGLALANGAGVWDSSDEAQQAILRKGWGIPTATDIALAWLVARTVFGKGHPAVNFLLLLAVADDAIGLGIIAVFYGDPSNPTDPRYLGLVLLAMGIAFAMRRLRVTSWIPYIVIAGPISWSGLMLAHLHPALALVFVVPFLPGPGHDTGMYEANDETDELGEALAARRGVRHSPLHLFEHQLKLFVDFGLFFFAMGNAGVELAGIGAMTWIVLASLVVGKTLGITAFGLFGKAIGFPLPEHMGLPHLMMAGFVAALGLTVALFVAGAAFPMDADLLGQAKMGALFSGFVGLAAISIGRLSGLSQSSKASLS